MAMIPSIKSINGPFMGFVRGLKININNPNINNKSPIGYAADINANSNESFELKIGTIRKFHIIIPAESIIMPISTNIVEYSTCFSFFEGR